MNFLTAQKCIDKKVEYLGNSRVIKGVSQCAYGSDVVVAFLDDGSVLNIDILKDPETGNLLGDK